MARRGSDLVANTNSTATSYSHTGLTAWSTRHYRVSAINSAGTGTASNTANATNGAAPGPDLVVDTPTVADIHPIVGTFFSLYATVRNQGNAASGPATLLFYRSTDSTITTSDERIGAGSTISGLSPTEPIIWATNHEHRQHPALITTERVWSLQRTSPIRQTTARPL